jgi:hypothetical protein
MNLHARTALYYAVEANSVEIVELLIEFGVEPNGPEEAPPNASTPLLAYAIFHGRNANVNMRGVVQQLLFHGANPNVIPQDMWIRHWETPKVAGPICNPGPEEWCYGAARAMLAPALHHTHRFSLYRASQLETTTAERRQTAIGNNMMDLLKLPYFFLL